MTIDHLFGTPEAAKILCPTCKSEEWDAKQNQYELFRECRKCGNRWSGGSAGAGQPDFSRPENVGLVPPPGVPAPDDDLPFNQYTGAGFRDPGKNHGGGDDW